MAHQQNTKDKNKKKPIFSAYKLCNKAMNLVLILKNDKTKHNIIYVYIILYTHIGNNIAI